MSLTSPFFIVNADDFGLDQTTNTAILSAFAAGIISSTTLLVNTPGFLEACALAHENRLLERIGIHLNLTMGTPLTDPIRALRRFCTTDGEFAAQRSFIPLSYTERNALATELLAQIQCARQQHLPLTHADSHHHIHTVYPIYTVVCGALQQCRIRALRLSRNCGALSPLNWCAKAIFNTLLRWHGFYTTQYFGSIHDFSALCRTGVCIRSGEIMTHPTWDGEGNLVDRLDGHLLTPAIHKVVQNVTMQSYGIAAVPVTLRAA